MGKNCQLFPLFYCMRTNTLTKEVWECLPLNIYWLFILLTNGDQTFLCSSEISCAGRCVWCFLYGSYNVVTLRTLLIVRLIYMHYWPSMRLIMHIDLMHNAFLWLDRRDHIRMYFITFKTLVVLFAGLPFWNNLGCSILRLCPGSQTRSYIHLASSRS